MEQGRGVAHVPKMPPSRSSVANDHRILATASTPQQAKTHTKESVSLSLERTKISGSGNLLASRRAGEQETHKPNRGSRPDSSS